MKKYYPLIDKNTNFDAVILGDGDYPFAEIPLTILRNANFICCCDGAVVKHIKNGGKLDAIVGDGDSIPENFKRKYKNILHIETEQETNDQTKATRFCINKGFNRIAYIGATGKREDHTLGNISHLITYLKEYKIDAVMLTDYGYFVASQGNSKFASFKGQQISFFNIDCSKFESKGTIWETSAYKYWWQGTLNEALGDEIEILSDGFFLVFRTYVSKNAENNKLQ
ncbi:thiamine diphosphokinase [Brachyspira sp.]|uniref:thiamine diphosphokinase n=1 Tax=Brachyspira sp. TaxID=1977261 RepID=UPI003D7E90FA